MQRKVKILGTGRYLPGNAVSAAELGARLGLEQGWVESRSGVLNRYFVKDETSSHMGALAAEAALASAGLDFSDVDCLVCTSGAPEQVIPCTAALIQKAMGQADSGVACFDINSTCLSFLTGLDTLSYLVAAGRYRRVLIVATEIASVALNWNDRESASIFGDAAAAVVIGQAGPDEPSEILAGRQETYSSGAHLTQARGGGTKHHPRQYPGTLAEYTDEFCLFEMDGKAVFKLSAQVLPGFVERTLAPAGLTLDDIKLVVPHQASMTALGLVQRRLGLSDDRWMVIAPEFGNTIAASIPLALHEAITRGRMQRGDTIMLLGTSAGFSVGALALTY